VPQNGHQYLMKGVEHRFALVYFNVI